MLELVKRSLQKSNLIKLFTQLRSIVDTHSLTLTMDFSNLWKHCYRFIQAFSTQNKTTWLSAISSQCLAALPAKKSASNIHMRQNTFNHYLKQGCQVVI